MPFVDIDLARGKTPEYLQSISAAVREALVQELEMDPDDNFQLIHQHEPGEMAFTRTFRGGPRSEDWLVVRITDGRERTDKIKRRFYRTLVARLHDDPGVRPEDVFVMIHVTPKENFSFAAGIAGSEVAATQALDRAASVPGRRDAYTRQEMVDAIMGLFGGRDRRRFVAMLRDDFVLKIPATLPYGGELRGPGQFDAFFARMEGEFYTSFVTHIDRVIEADDHLIAPITIDGQGKSSDETMTVENLWLFDIADGNFVRAQIYADTAAGVRTAG